MSGHDHSHTGGHGPDRSASRRALGITLALTGSFVVAEVVGGLLTGSLALLADAAHMLSDTLSIAVALVAIWLAGRPPSVERTFGYQRAEILAALFNGITLVAVSIWIFIEAARRFGDPPEVLGGPMLVVAILGTLVNIGAAAVLHRGGDDSLNVSAALRHVLADLLGSVGVIVAAVVILTTGWAPIDPLVSILIGLLILVSSWSILRDSVQILLEGSPPGIDVEEVGQAMLVVPGVDEVHDLHVWTITSGFSALAAHVLVSQEVDCHAKRRELEEMLAERFGLEHTTLQADHTATRLLQLESNPKEGQRAKRAFLFADIAGFTALTETHGDSEAIAVVDDFARHADKLLGQYGAERVKTIGDALMIAAPDADSAIRLAVELVHREMAQEGHPAVRAGIHYGEAVERSGDWMGATVNTAARVAGLARGGEVLVTGDTRAAVSKSGGFRFHAEGSKRLRNIAAEVEVYRVVDDESQAALEIDPVCQMALGRNSAVASLTYAGRSVRFCSERCRRTFEEAPERYGFPVAD